LPFLALWALSIGILCFGAWLRVGSYALIPRYGVDGNFFLGEVVAAWRDGLVTREVLAEALAPARQSAAEDAFWYFALPLTFLLVREVPRWLRVALVAYLILWGTIEAVFLFTDVIIWFPFFGGLMRGTVPINMEDVLEGAYEGASSLPLFLAMLWYYVKCLPRAATASARLRRSREPASGLEQR
jgi:hypothetical protein